MLQIHTLLCPFYSVAALLAMQSAVLTTAIPYVRLSVRPPHAVPYRYERK